MSIPRAIRLAFRAFEVSEGSNVHVRRSVGTPKLRHLTPFLMFDHFHIKDDTGFPDHPHRGQETITYLLSGGVEHEDFTGHRGVLGPGDLQFMTAGRGIVHAEMPPEHPDGTPNIGLQLWVDLPEHLKSCEPRYRDLRAEEIPHVTADDGKVSVKVIAGKSQGVDSVADLTYTPVWIFDVTLKPGGTINQPIPGDFNAFAYTLQGTTSFGVADNAATSTSLNTPSARKTVSQYYNVVFQEEGEYIHASNAQDATEDSRFVIVAGQRLDQEIVQYGPFVASDKKDIYQAMLDYQSYQNGFERAKKWQSQISKRIRY